MYPSIDQPGIRPARKCRYQKPACALLLVAALSSLATTIALVHGFLAVNHPNGQGILIVEAWIPAQAVRESARVFDRGSYQYLVVVGGPTGEANTKTPNTPTYADRAFNDLVRLGFDMSKVVKISVPSQKSRRTFANAKAVRDWLRQSDSSIRDVDVFTLGAHARKSWILFQHALGTDYRVGIVAGSEISYNPARWLLSQRGSWVVARNLAGYLYTKLWVSLDAIALSRPADDELLLQHQAFVKSWDACGSGFLGNAGSWAA
jgi:uncharacterized SAM-binding protein YcdF (DUF218 family)